MSDNSSSCPPDLPTRFQEPKGWRWHSFTNPKGRNIRFGTVSPEDKVPDAVVIGLQGLSEFTEKYFEVAHDLLKRNISFWMLDWQGQGESDRHLKNPHRRHSNSFEEDIEDLHYFLTEYVTYAAVHPDVGRIPLVMLGHSMGANIGLHYLARHPDRFSCAAFCGPLVSIKALTTLPTWLRLGTTGMFNRLLGKSYVFGGTDWHPEIRDSKTKALLSSDPERRNIQDHWCHHNPALQVGHVTFGWLHEANISCARLLSPGYAQKIKPPCLFALAGQDHLVDNNASRRLAATMAQATVLELPDARHEILMERDDIRDRFLQAFDQLLVDNNIKDLIKPF